MSANTTVLINAIQASANSISVGNTGLEILQLIESTKFVDSANLVYSYANTLPTANATHIGMTAYVNNDGLYICDGTQWYKLN